MNLKHVTYLLMTELTRNTLVTANSTQWSKNILFLVYKSSKNLFLYIYLKLVGGYQTVSTQCMAGINFEFYKHWCDYLFHLHSV